MFLVIERDTTIFGMKIVKDYKSRGGANGYVSRNSEFFKSSGRDVWVMSRKKYDKAADDFADMMKAHY